MAEFVLKVDIDFDVVKEGLVELHERAVRAVLRELGYELARIVRRRSPSGKGWHEWIYVRGPEPDPKLLAALEWLCGGDPVRCKINLRRVERGIPHFSVLFSKVIGARVDERCEECRLRRAVRELLGEGER